MDTNNKARIGVVASFVAVLVGLTVAPANAAVDPGTVTAITSGFTDLTGLVTGTLAVALFGIVVAIVAITMGVRWLRKGAAG